MDLQTVIDEIKNWDNILVLSHASPDGDTIGSAAAMVYALALINI